MPDRSGERVVRELEAQARVAEKHGDEMGDHYFHGLADGLDKAAELVRTGFDTQEGLSEAATRKSVSTDVGAGDSGFAESPQEEPARCPTCGSDDPDVCLCGTAGPHEHMHNVYSCRDPFHRCPTCGWPMYAIPYATEGCPDSFHTTEAEPGKDVQTIWECEECGHATRLTNVVPESALDISERDKLRRDAERVAWKLGQQYGDEKKAREQAESERDKALEEAAAYRRIGADNLKQYTKWVREAESERDALIEERDNPPRARTGGNAYIHYSKFEEQKARAVAAESSLAEAQRLVVRYRREKVHALARLEAVREWAGSTEEGPLWGRDESLTDLLSLLDQPPSPTDDTERCSCPPDLPQFRAVAVAIDPNCPVHSTEDESGKVQTIWECEECGHATRIHNLVPKARAESAEAETRRLRSAIAEALPYIRPGEAKKILGLALALSPTTEEKK